jgi:hypothetical protein
VTGDMGNVVFIPIEAHRIYASSIYNGYPPSIFLFLELRVVHKDLIGTYPLFSMLDFPLPSSLSLV